MTRRRHPQAGQPPGKRRAIAIDVRCPYCLGQASFMPSSAALYNGRDYGPAWVCLKPSCEAWVGCHPSTDTPLGRLANAELRKAKTAAHGAFDPLWHGKMRRDDVSKSRARRAGYAWLAQQLGIAATECHIGMFDVAMCERVVAICTPFTTRQRRSAA